MRLGSSSWWELSATNPGDRCVVSSTKRSGVSTLLSLESIPGHQSQVSVPRKGSRSAPVVTPDESGLTMHMGMLWILEGLGEVIAQGIKAVKGYKMESLHIQDDGTGACLSPESICRRPTLKLLGHLQS